LYSYDFTNLSFDSLLKIYLNYQYIIIKDLLCFNHLYIQPDELLEDSGSSIFLRNVYNYEQKQRKTKCQREESETFDDIEHKYIEKMMTQFARMKNKYIDSAMKNIEYTALPLLERIYANIKDGNDKKIVELIIKTLSEISDPLGIKLDKLKPFLTNTEIEICSMIKQRMSSKAIGKVLKISHTTVERHRNNVRKKLKLDKSGITLINFLNSK
ncbi:helix-turn-helix transcriptional regulator, partial [Candidatus Dependentiae bacterium]|nr:helix-turn-helix transcriptional regulator [Candidatus Dependentiae bacterium]